MAMIVSWDTWPSASAIKAAGILITRAASEPSRTSFNNRSSSGSLRAIVRAGSLVWRRGPNGGQLEAGRNVVVMEVDNLAMRLHRFAPPPPAWISAGIA